MIMNKNVTDNLKTIYQKKEDNMENPNVFEILQYWNNYGRDSKVGLKFFVLMHTLTRRDLSRGWAIQNPNDASSFFIKELKNFDYDKFASVTTHVEHSRDSCSDAVNELLTELSVFGSNIKRQVVN